MRESLHSKKLKANRVICSICQRQCIISPSSKGFCQLRENKLGKLYALNYEKITKEGIIKPIFKHFLPNSDTYAVGTEGENFKPFESKKTKKATAEQLVKRAIRKSCSSLTFTYNEPTMSLELLLETAKFARSNRLKFLLETNLFVTDKVLKDLCKFAHGVLVSLPTVDKELFLQKTGVKLFPILKNITNASNELWVEIKSDLTGLNTGQVIDIANFIVSVNKSIPWIISGNEEAKEIGKKAGLLYVYEQKELGTCPKCNFKLNKGIKKNTCECGKKLSGVF